MILLDTYFGCRSFPRSKEHYDRLVYNHPTPQHRKDLLHLIGVDKLPEKGLQRGGERLRQGRNIALPIGYDW